MCFSTDSIDTELLYALQQKMEWELRYQRCVKGTPASFSSPVMPSENPSLSLFLQTAWNLIATETNRICATPKPLLAYPGGIGAYSEHAALHLRSHTQSVSVPLFEDVFKGVFSEVYEYGIVPLENSTGGMVDAVTHLLWKYPPHIIGAISLPIQHVLLGVKGARKNDIEYVVSHPQAIRQCRQFLQKQEYSFSEMSTTAAAARFIAEKNNIHYAAIGSKHAAMAYGLSVLKENITDRGENNYTRFGIISKEKTDALENIFKKGRWISSVAFQIANTPGSLYRVLAIALAEKINFTRLDSVLLSPGEYFFIADFSGKETDSSVERFLEWLEENTSSYTYFGNYKEIVADIN